MCHQTFGQTNSKVHILLAHHRKLYHHHPKKLPGQETIIIEFIQLAELTTLIKLTIVINVHNFRVQRTFTFTFNLGY